MTSQWPKGSSIHAMWTGHQGHTGQSQQGHDGFTSVLADLSVVRCVGEGAATLKGWTIITATCTLHVIPSLTPY